MKKPLPILKSDKEAEHFVATSDLTEYELSRLRVIRFDFNPKSEPVDRNLSKRKPRGPLAIKR
jgi:predicted DNA binding CopG/RHH family protein